MNGFPSDFLNLDVHQVIQEVHLLDHHPLLALLGLRLRRRLVLNRFFLSDFDDILHFEHNFLEHFFTGMLANFLRVNLVERALFAAVRLGFELVKFGGVLPTLGAQGLKLRSHLIIKIKCGAGTP